MPTPPAPEAAPSAWDRMTIGGKTAPGRVVSVDAKREWDVDKKKPAGGNDATTTINGRKPSEFDITLEWWQGDGIFDSAVEWKRCSDLIALVFPEKNNPVPLDVAHPIFELHGVRSLFFESMGGPKQTGTDLWQMTLHASIFKPQTKKKSATTTPKASIAIGNALGRPAPFGPPPPQISNQGSAIPVSLNRNWVPPEAPSHQKVKP